MCTLPKGKSRSPRPVSARTSRCAAASSSSPGRTSPFGKSQLAPARSTSRRTPRSVRRKTTAPAARVTSAANASPLPDVLPQEREGALARELRALGVVRATLVAVEPVTGGIDVERLRRLRLADLLDVGHRDLLVGLAEMEHHRAARSFAGDLSD